jgi:hypothetical protein
MSHSASDGEPLAPTRMSRREDFHELMRENLARWGTRHAALVTALDRGAAGEDRRRLLDDWAERCAAGVATLDELRVTRGERWEVLKHELARLWHDLAAFMAEAEKPR